MKQSNKTYFFLGLTVLVWALVIWRFMDLSENSSPEFSKDLPAYPTDMETQKRSNYRYQLNYRNPFDLSTENLSEESHVSLQKQNKNTSEKKKITPQKKAIVFPDIKFIGTIKTQSKTKYLIEVKNETYTLLNRDSIGSLWVYNLCKDSFLVRQKDSVKVIFP
ncbi:MAG: hypothetical protein N4A45_10790 [Flavobacteriales bacterium]|jgi:hypothetical protein|nr:hypothetical protein [Flavobacteriales bacterium]